MSECQEDSLMARAQASGNARAAELPAASYWAAISFLLQAHREAEKRKLPDWEFGVEIEALERIGVTVNDLRGLIADGYIEHRIEVTGGRSTRRVFRKAPNSRFSRRSCFVLTAAGILRARRMKGKASRGSPASASMSAFNAEAGRPLVPFWDEESQVLWYDNCVVKRFKRPAQNQQAILREFQRRKWKQRVPNPLPRVERMNRKVRLRDTLKRLNQGHELQAVRFHSTDCGHFVTWTRVKRSTINRPPIGHRAATR
jgi:hypothetical protein